MTEVDVSAFRRKRTLVLGSVEDLAGHVATWVVPPFSHDVEYSFWEWWRAKRAKNQAEQEKREAAKAAGQPVEESLPIRTKGEDWAELLALAVQRERLMDGNEVPVQLDAQALLRGYDGDTLQFCGERVLRAFFARTQSEDEEAKAPPVPSGNSPATTTSATSPGSVSGTAATSTPTSPPPPIETN